MSRATNEDTEPSSQEPGARMPGQEHRRRRQSSVAFGLSVASHRGNQPAAPLSGRLPLRVNNNSRSRGAI